MEGGQTKNAVMEEKLFRVSGIEACRKDSAIHGGVECARSSALALIAEQTKSQIKNGLISSRKDLSGQYVLTDIGVVVWVTEAPSVAATC